MSFAIVLPLPPSINAAHTVGKKLVNKRAIASAGSDRIVSRSAEYNDWVQFASIEYRKQFPYGAEKIKGRIRCDFIFVFKTAAGDTDNRIKVLQDFLQGKFFENDSQIDEPHAYKRISKEKGGKVIAIIREIDDRRYEDPLELYHSLK